MATTSIGLPLISSPVFSSTNLTLIVPLVDSPNAKLGFLTNLTDLSNLAKSLSSLDNLTSNPKPSFFVNSSDSLLLDKNSLSLSAPYSSNQFSLNSTERPFEATPKLNLANALFSNGTSVITSYSTPLSLIFEILRVTGTSFLVRGRSFSYRFESVKRSPSLSGLEKISTFAPSITSPTLFVDLISSKRLEPSGTFILILSPFLRKNS